MKERPGLGRPSEIIPVTETGRARRVIEAGGVIAFRTDTFYGLGADPFNKEAVARINRLKGREGVKPVLVVVSALEEAERFISEETRLFKKLTEHYWPGAMTVVCNARPTVPRGITAGSGTVGIRLPFDEEVRELVKACGGALTATSANPAGEPPARTAPEVSGYFPSELDLIVDGGAARTLKPSTVIDVSQVHPRLIREGEITRANLEKFLDALGEKLYPPNP